VKIPSEAANAPVYSIGIVVFTVFKQIVIKLPRHQGIKASIKYACFWQNSDISHRLLTRPLLSCGFVYLKEMFKRGIESPDEIAKLNVPVLAAVPYTPSLKKSTVDNHKESVPLVVREPNNPAVEVIRGIRTSVVFEAKHSNKNTIIITGPTAGIGKTFTSVNLAASLAQAGKKYCYWIWI
jgi:hypothetical protein